MSGIPQALAGLISSDAWDGYLQTVNDVRGRGPSNPQIEAGGGRGVGGNPGPGSSGKIVAPDYRASRHLEDLRAAGSDQEKFSAAHEKLSSDKSVTNDDLKQIVKDYDAGVAMGKTRADHLKQINQAFVRRARFENKIK